MNTLIWLQTMARMARPPRPAHPGSVTASGAGLNPQPPAVAGLDPITAPDDPQLIAAAATYARRGDTDAETRLLWGRYAYQAAARLWGAAHPATIGAGRAYQQVLTAQGLTVDAVRVCEQRLAAHEPGPDTGLALASRCEHAVALHRDGQCEQASQQVRICLRQWWASPHGYGHPATVLLSAAVIAAGCGRTSVACRVLSDDAAHLAHLSPSCRHAAAGWLATAALTHPRWCDATPPAPLPSGTVEQHRRRWLTVLNRGAATTPATPLPHRQVAP